MIKQRLVLTVNIDDETGKLGCELETSDALGEPLDRVSLMGLLAYAQVLVEADAYASFHSDECTCDDDD